MAIQTENPTRSGSSTKVTTYVNQQLEMARRGVKSTDLIGEILTLVAIVISFLILAAIWDGWIQPMSVAGRWVAFGLMMSICLRNGVSAPGKLFDMPGLCGVHLHTKSMVVY